MAAALTLHLKSPVTPISMDDYWIDDHIPNWEVPEALDAVMFASELTRLVEHLKQGQLPQFAQAPRGKVAIARPPREGDGDTAPTTQNGARDPIVIVVEGFLLYHWVEIAQMCTHKIFIKGSEKVCRERRYHRKYPQRDPAAMPVSYFEFYKNVWDHYVRFLPSQKENCGDALEIDGSSVEDDVLTIALTHLATMSDRR